MITIRTFKRHYHKAKEASQVFWANGSLKLEIKGDDKNVQAKLTTPSEKETIRFVVLMRRFLDASDPLYYRNVSSG